MTVFVHSMVIICFKFLFVDCLGPTATLSLFKTNLPRSTSEAINKAFDKTIRIVVAGKAYRIAAERESGYKQLKMT